MIREYSAKEIITHNGSPKLWKNSVVWINHKHHTYFVPIWRNASSSFLFNVAEQYGYKLVSLPRNESWASSYIGYTFLRYPPKRFLGQIDKLSEIYNYTIEESMQWWLSGGIEDANRIRPEEAHEGHMKTQCSFLEGLAHLPLCYIDADNIQPIGHEHIDNVLETLQNTKRYNDISKRKEELNLQLKDYKSQIKSYYLEDYKLFKENIK